MRILIHRAVIVSAAFVLATGACALAARPLETPVPGVSVPQAVEASGTVRAAVDAGNKRYLAALVSGDANAFAAVFASDGVLLPAGAAPVYGRSAIAAEQRASFKNLKFTGGEIVTTDLHVSGDLAYEIGHYTFKIASTNMPGEVRSAGGRYLTIWRRAADGSWQIAVDAGQPNAPN